LPFGEDMKIKIPQFFCYNHIEMELKFPGEEKKRGEDGKE
jgi:hypothetical protein